MTPEVRQAQALVVRQTINRLEETYSDFIQGIKEFERIPEFFREHLYSPPNKDKRDAALESLYEKLKSVTGPEMTENIHNLIVLIQLTDDLDVATAHKVLEGPMKGKTADEIAEASITTEQLNHCIGQAGCWEDRQRQVHMIGDTLTFFFTLSKLPLIKLVMAPIRVAASLVGAGELVDTMETGYQISRNIKDMKPFVDAFNEREKALLDRLQKEYS